MDYLSLCAIVKDEDPDDLREWVRYHRLIGVERFFIYDNQSKTSLRQTLSDFIGQGYVLVVDIAGQVMQHVAYTHCLHHFGAQSHWVAFIDADEFIVPLTNDDLRVFLKPYEPFGALGVNWLLFGSCGHDSKPAGGLLESFTLRTPADYPNNVYIKSIVQPRDALFPLSPHDFLYRSGRFCVNENHLPIHGQMCPNSVEKIRIHHYYCRSRQQYEQKLQRGRAAAFATRQDRGFEKFEHVDRAAVIEDRVILILRARREAAADLPQVVPLVLPGAPLLPVHTAGVLIEHFLQVLQAALQVGDQQTTQLLLKVMPLHYGHFLEWQLGLSDLFTALQDYHTAWRHLKAAWKLDAQSPAVLKRMGDNLLQRGEAANAEKLLQTALRQFPQDAGLLASLGEVYIALQRYEEALVLLRNALVFRPGNQVILAQLAKVQQLMRSSVV